MQNLYFEILAFLYVLQHQEIIQNFKKDFFTHPTIIAIFDIAKTFVINYKVEPTCEQLLELMHVQQVQGITDDDVKMIFNNRSNLTQYDQDWLYESVNKWGRWQNFYKGLENVIAYVKTLPQPIQYDNIELYIERSKNIFTKGVTYTTNVYNGHDFFDIENHKLDSLDTHTTGYPFMDECLNGGFAAKTLNVLMGAPKVGKSMWLCNIAANSVKSGINTVYITLEMSYQLVAQRIGSNLLGIPIDQYKKASQDPEYLKQKMLAFHNQFSITQPGKFILEEFPTSSATADDIESFILKKEEEISIQLGEPFKFKNVCIDYLNIMKDKKNPNSENMYLKVKSICEDVRAMAQRNEWCVISLTQVNRAGYDSSDLNMANVSESGGLIATVDSLFGIIQTTFMNAQNVYYLKALALRNSPHMGDKKKFNFIGNYLRIEEDKNEDIIPDNIEIPSMYTSATQHAIQTKQYNKVPQQQPMAVAPEMNSSLSSTEKQLQITGQNLFS